MHCLEAWDTDHSGRPFHPLSWPRTVESLWPGSIFETLASQKLYALPLDDGSGSEGTFTKKQLILQAVLMRIESARFNKVVNDPCKFLAHELGLAH